MNAWAGFVLTLVAGAAPAFAENWPHWRGPSRDGTSRETGIPTRFTQSENVAWKVPMPAWSGSTPIIWGETIFLNVAEGDSLELWALQRKDGSLRWKRPLSGGNTKMRKQNMSSPSPVTDGKAVWVMTGTGMLKSFDFEGRERWSRDIPKDYGAFGLNWGYASSPLLHGGDLFVQVLHGMKTDDPSYVLRIDGATGRTKWRVERPTKAIKESPDSYTTPALLTFKGQEEIVISGGDCVTGHDPVTGKELWRADGLNPENHPFYRIVASPVVAGDMVYVPSRERPLLAIRAGGRGDITSSHRVWSFNDGPDVPSPLVHGSYMYLVTDNGISWCLEAKTGKVVWGPQRLKPGTYSASPVLVGGHIYAVNEEGIVSVFKAGPTFELVSENELHEYVLSSPAVSEGQMFIRTDKFLYAIGERRPSTAH